MVCDVKFLKKLLRKQKKIEENNLSIHHESIKYIKLGQAQKLYIEHVAKPYYKAIVDYMVNRPTKIFVISGVDAVKKVRKFIGATMPDNAEKNTIRNMFKVDPLNDPITNAIRNTVHASADLEAATYEIKVIMGTYFNY